MTTTRTRPLRVALYTRVSEDRSGIARSPHEQEVELRREVAARHWRITYTDTDNDRSASRYSRKDRPGWRRIIATVASGTIDVLMVWEASRLTRNLEEYVELSKACRAGGVKLAYGGTLYDLDDPDDEFRVTLDMGLGARESGVTRKRILRNVRANAEAGRPHGKTPFGYRRIYDPTTGRLERQIPDERTAPVVREMFGRVAAGESLRGIANLLNRRGVLTRQGSSWSAIKVRQTVELATHLGHRTHRGQVVVENAWPAIVDEALFHRAQAVLADRRHPGHDTSVKHLLSGLISCERCGSGVAYSSLGPRALAVYRCKAAGHVARVAHVLEPAVRLLIVERLAEPDALEVFVPTSTDAADTRAELKALEARLADADDALADGDMTPRAHGVLEGKLRPRIDDLSATIRQAAREVPAPVVRLAQGRGVIDVGDRWDALTLAQRRLVIRSLLVDCELRAAGASRTRRDLGLRFRWAGVGEPIEV